jgi:hypothetical protein
MPADDPKTESTSSRSKKTADEDQFTRASAITAARGIADVSPHVMAAALHDKADDDPVTRQEAIDAVAKVREPEKEA